MKKSVPLILAALLGIYGLTKWSSKGSPWPLTVTSENATTLVAFGDSLTLGTGATAATSYPAWLEKMSGVKAINLGRNGETTSSALGRIEEALKPKPEIVLLTLGGNDLLSRNPLGDTLENLRTIFQRLLAAGVMPVYLSIEPPGVGDNWSMALEHLCKEEGVLYVPGVMKGLWGNGNLMADQIHPNGEGYKVMAERVFAAVRPYLRCTGEAC